MSNTGKGVGIIVVMLISFFSASFIATVHASNAESNSSLIGSLETIVNAVNYTNDIDAVYQGMIVGKTSMQQLINAYNALSSPTSILQWTPILSKLGYANQTTIEWALNNQQMMSDGLPNTGADSLSGSSQAFLVYDRFLILAYGYAVQYNYDLAKWNLTQAYDSFKASVDSATYPALLWVDQNGNAQSIQYGPRYYDECGETIDCFLDFYSLGITTALNDALTTWLWTNSNLWSGTNYNYALNWAGYECEAGGFLQIALKLWHDDSILPDPQNLLTDLENRFLAEQFSSPQWLDGVVCHMAEYNSELRLENTVMAWAAIFGSYGELNSTYQTNVQDMLTGAGGTTTPAWMQLLQSPLCGSNFPYFLEHSDSSGPSYDATATGADLLFLLGIVPQTAVLVVPVEENSYEYIYNILDPEFFNINLTTNTITIALATAGTLNFQFNQTVTGTFSSSGIYTVQFSPDWNTILNITFVSNLPSNRQYMYTTLNTAPRSYMTSSVSIASLPNSAVANSLVTVTATVSGSNPTGTITWSTNSSTGHFSSAITSLNAGISTTTYNDSRTGTAKITATYSGDTNNSASIGSATLTITPGAITTITVSPAISSLTEGTSVTFTATAYDAYGNSWDITSMTTWSISNSAGGSWSGSTYTTGNMGNWSVTASNSGVQGSVKIAVYYVIDFYHTGRINFNDITYFVSAYIQYYQTGVINPACDLNHDGKLNFQDLLLLVQYYIAYIQSL
jgi:hypothetical protein